MDSAIAPDRRSAAVDRIDSSSVLVAKGRDIAVIKPIIIGSISAVGGWICEYRK